MPHSPPIGAPRGVGSKLVRYGMIGGGTTLVVSAVVNVYATFQLLEPSDAESLGVTRTEILSTYAVFFSLGALLIWVGLRSGKPPGPKNAK